MKLRNQSCQLILGHYIWSGYLFVEKYIPCKMMAGTNGQWIVYYIVKLLLFVVIGVFTAPFTCLWAVFRVIKAFR